MLPSSDFEPVTPCNRPSAEIYDLGEEVSRSLGYLPKKHARLFDLVKEKMGGEIVRKNFWLSEDSGSIEIRGLKDFTIFVPDDANPDRERFTVAHELGHYVLHYVLPICEGETPKPKRASRYGDDLSEKEANWFAAALLMPEETFKAEWNKAVKSEADPLTHISSIFGVSRRTAYLRAKHIGLSCGAEDA